MKTKNTSDPKETNMGIEMISATTMPHDIAMKNHKKGIKRIFRVA